MARKQLKSKSSKPARPRKASPTVASHVASQSSPPPAAVTTSCRRCGRVEAIEPGDYRICASCRAQGWASTPGGDKCMRYGDGSIRFVRSW